MAALDLSTAQDMLKEWYNGQRVTELMYKASPILALMPKKAIGGKNYPLPNRISTPQGRSANFAAAQANKTPSAFSSFHITTVTDYSLASIASNVSYASEDPTGAFVDAMKEEIDGAWRALKRSAEWKLWADGVGTIGAVGSVSATNPEVITLNNPDDSVRFELGQTLQVRNSAATGTVRSFATGVVQAVVTGVDRSAGTIRLNVDNSGATSTIAVGDFIMVVGDYNNGFQGIKSWIPDNAPSATPFFGVDRTQDTFRLSGGRASYLTTPYDEAIIDAARILNQQGKQPDYLFLNYAQYKQLEKTLGARVRYELVKPKGMNGEALSAEISFRSIVVAGPEGEIKVFADKDVQAGRGYMLTLDAWQYCYYGSDPFMMLNLDGNNILREAGADAYEVRLGTYNQLGCMDPGANLVMRFT
jgi:hypothetical protein